MKNKLFKYSAIFLSSLIFFVPSKVIADSGTEFLKKCINLKSEDASKAWNKFRAGKEKFKASRKNAPLKDLKKKELFDRGYCLGYISASAKALSVFTSGKFCPPKTITNKELSVLVIKYAHKNRTKALKLNANQLITKALLKSFSCRKLKH